VVAACIAALEVMEKEPELQARLWENARHFKAGLEQLGFDCGQSETPITPVIVGEGERAVALSDELRQRGVFATPIGFPTVARDRGRVRTGPWKPSPMPAGSWGLSRPAPPAPRRGERNRGPCARIVLGG